MSAPYEIPVPDPSGCSMCGVELGTGLLKVAESKLEGVCQSCAPMIDARYTKERQPHFGTLSESFR